MGVIAGDGARVIVVGFIFGDVHYIPLAHQVLRSTGCCRHTSLPADTMGSLLSMW